MVTRSEYRLRRVVGESDYKEFTIYKTREFKRIRETIRDGFTFWVDENDVPVKGSIRYEAHMKENVGQAMTEEYKTMKEVKQAIDHGEYIYY